MDISRHRLHIVQLKLDAKFRGIIYDNLYLKRSIQWTAVGMGIIKHDYDVLF